MRAFRPSAATASRAICSRKVVYSRPSSSRRTNRVFPDCVLSAFTSATVTTASAMAEYFRAEAPAKHSHGRGRPVAAPPVLDRVLNGRVLPAGGEAGVDGIRRLAAVGEARLLECLTRGRTAAVAVARPHHALLLVEGTEEARARLGGERA